MRPQCAKGHSRQRFLLSMVPLAIALPASPWVGFARSEHRLPFQGFSPSDERCTATAPT